MASLQALRGARTALPVVLEKGTAAGVPALCRRRRALEKEHLEHPVPASGPEVTPDIVIAPLVGVDGQSYRLGYGGGFFDRTLASLARKPFAIGVSCRVQRIETIHPQPRHRDGCRWWSSGREEARRGLAELVDDPVRIGWAPARDQAPCARHRARHRSRVEPPDGPQLVGSTGRRERWRLERAQGAVQAAVW